MEQVLTRFKKQYTIKLDDNRKTYLQRESGKRSAKGNNPNNATVLK
jgi:hypothetical protein